MLLEEKLLKKLFNLDGEFTVGSETDFDLKVKGSPGYVIVKLNGNKAELFSPTKNKFGDKLEGTKELSEEDIIALKKEGYEWE